MIDLGKIKITWKGEYAAATEYEKDDAVFFEGSSYIHVAADPTTGTAPTAGADNATWERMALGAPALTTRGALIIKGASGPIELVPGTAGKVLASNGPGEDPTYQTIGLHVAALAAGPNGHHRSGKAIMSDGTVRSWGYTGVGNHGNGANNTGNKKNPIIVRLPDAAYTSGIRKLISSFLSHMVILNNGDVYTWGYNTFGQLGHGHTANVFEPTKVTTLNGINIVDGAFSTRGYYDNMASMFKADDGRLFGCGYGAHGTTGHGAAAQINTPVELSKTNWVQFAITTGHAGSFMGIDDNEDLFTSGYNAYGQSGQGNSTATYSPGQVTLPGPCMKVSGTDDDYTAYTGHKVAIVRTQTVGGVAQGKVFTWGYNGYGQLGDGTTTNRNTPVEITSLGEDNVDCWALGGGFGFTIVKKADGSLRTFGYNGYGMLGVGSTTNASSPSTPSGIVGDASATVEKLVVSGSYTTWTVAVLMSDGNVYAAGYNGNAACGVGTTANSVTTFQKVLVGNDTVEDVAPNASFQTENGFILLTDRGEALITGYGVDYANGEVSGNVNVTASPIRF